MKPYLRDFLRDDAGAITIDWVALTAGLLLLGIMVVYAIFNGGVSGLVNDISSTLAGITTDVDTGDAPGLNGEAVALGTDTFDLAGGGTIPIGSVVSHSSTFDIGIDTPDGNHIDLSAPDFSPLRSVVPVGSTIAANSTFKLPDGSSVSASSVSGSSGGSGSGLVCHGCENPA